jgi:Fe-S cluster assembly protein SufD
MTSAAVLTGIAWLDALRDTAAERFEKLGFPTTHDEDWRFTSVAPIARTNFLPAQSMDGPAPGEIASALFPAACQLVFMNGRYMAGLSTPAGLPPGVQVGSLAEALRAGSDAVKANLARRADISSHAFAALNTANIEDGAYVWVPPGMVVETPIHLVYVSEAGAAPAVSHPRSLILAGANSQATFIESYFGRGEQVYLTNAVTEIVAGDNAVVEHYKLQMEQPQAFHVATLQVEQGRAATFSSHSISLGGALVRNDVNSVLGEGAECTLNGLYLVNGKQHVDNHTAIDHAMPHGTSHELYKGILDGNASAVFNGRIYVRKDAQKTDAKQTNKNLVLSEDAVINTKPELQIWADDVRCTHGATIGQLDAEAVFYLQSRGIGKKEARDLLTEAFARDIIERIRVAPLRERLEEVLFERIDERRN